MAFSRYIYSGTKKLRCGYTTGSCAAMAAGAACRMLLTGAPVETASITTPSGVLVDAAIEDARIGADAASCCVRKDGGDDIDATDGLLVRAEVRPIGEGGAVPDAPECPADPDPASAGGVCVRIFGGAGVGTVTRAGLEQPVRSPAINSVPQAMIRAEVARACRELGRTGTFAVTVSVDGGEEAAARTFNPNLGIEGGISILGTTGIVEPRSLSALRDSIELEIRQHAAEGAKSIIVVPGNYGLDFVNASAELSRIADHVPIVACSNFIGAAIDCIAREGFDRALVVGHLGKMAKVAGGIMDTHSRTADCRVEVVCAHAACSGADAGTCRALMEAATTDACLDVLEAAGVLEPTLASLAGALGARLARRAAGAFDVAAVAFSNERGELFRTPGTDAVIEAMAAEGGPAGASADTEKGEGPDIRTRNTR